MSNNKANQVRKLSQSFFAPFPSRSDPSEQELLASDGDFKPRTQANTLNGSNPHRATPSSTDPCTTAWHRQAMSSSWCP